MKEHFLKVAFWEGVSYLVLLFIAMPLKYFVEMPMAVRVVGMAHGVLFVLFCILLLNLKLKKEFGWGMTFLAFVLSLLPFGTFYLEKQVRKQEA